MDLKIYKVFRGGEILKNLKNLQINFEFLKILRIIFMTLTPLLLMEKIIKTLKRKQNFFSFLFYLKAFICYNILHNKLYIKNFF